VFIVPTSTHNSTTFYNHIHTYTYTLKLTRWLPRHTTRRLYPTTLRATSEGSMAKVGLAIAEVRADKGEVPMVHCLTGPFDAANAKELGDIENCTHNKVHLLH
jgi:hypothetical protein